MPTTIKMSVEDEELNALVSVFDEVEAEEELENEEDDILSALLASNTDKDTKPLTNTNVTDKRISLVTNEKSLSKQSPRRQFNALQKPSTSSNAEGVFDSFFGIRVSNPKITLEVMNNYCHDLKKIKASLIQKNNIPKEGNWATMAVIVNKSECRKSLNGNEYLIWHISDMANGQDTPIKTILFGDCVKQYWKLQVGMVVLIINSIFDFDTDSKGFTLKLGKLAQVLELGFCPDFGTCKGVKINGESCTLFVNISKTDYCAYHIQNAARKVSARRGVFNSTSNIPPKSWRLKDPSSLEQSIGELKTNSRGGVEVRKFVKPISLHAKRQQVNTDNKKSGNKSVLEPPSQSDIKPTNNKALVRAMAAGGTKRRESCDLMQLSVTEPSIKRVKSMKDFISTQREQPNLGSRAQSGFVDLFSPEKKMKFRNQMTEELKIKKAAETLRRSTQNSVTDSKKSIVKKSIFQENLKIENSLEESSSSQREKSFTNSAILSLLNKKSKFSSEAVEDIQERQNQYFKNLEAVEKVETNITSLMEVKNCQVVTCQACDYTSVHQSEYCKSLGHIVKKHTADKRFFKCKNCSTRISCFKLMPTKPCQSCLMVSYERIAMREERKVHGEKLMIRGEEQKYIN